MALLGKKDRGPIVWLWLAEGRIIRLEGSARRGFEVQRLLQVHPVIDEGWRGHRFRREGGTLLTAIPPGQLAPGHELAEIAQIIPNGDSRQVFFDTESLFIAHESTFTRLGEHGL